MIVRIIVLLFSLKAINLLAAQQSSITQGDVVWHFDKEYEVGQFANGDWWVLAPVIITRIEPDFQDGYNGWEINPVPNTPYHGFDKDLYSSYYTPSLVPSLPCTIKTGIKSIVKAVSSSPGQERRIASAKVLTVVSEIPPGNGADVFRPPYCGTSKPYYYVDDINWSLLPSYEPVAGAPPLAVVEENFANTLLAHCTNVRYMRPIDAVPDDYQPANCPSINEAVLRLMLNDSQEAKKPAMIKVLQRGIDMIQWQVAGNVFPHSGHMPGLITIPAFTAALLDIPEYKTLLGTKGIDFEENHYIRESKVDSLSVFWGQHNTEAHYWDYIISKSGNRSNGDPYGYIDGGIPGQAYQIITINGFKGEILSAMLMPAVAAIYEPTLYRRLVTYVDRMVNTGVWTQPDPCAPYPYTPGSGIEDGRGVTWGEDPNNPGHCILDPDLEYYNSPTDSKCKDGETCGRFPEKHGTLITCLLYTSPSPRDLSTSRMPSSA